MKTADIKSLVRTNALKVAKANSPFWYTSGELGPYYINTHFLCGGEKSAVELLDLITVEANTPKTLPEKVINRLGEIYETSTEFKNVIDSLCEKIREELPLSEIAGISGGQRRDWFFAPIVAKQLELPCLYLYNDTSAYDEYGDPVDTVHGGVFINVCDLLRVGSSYTSKWIPAIEKLGGTLLYSAAIVDRCEGGKENICGAGVKKSISLFSFNLDFFQQALKEELVDQEQFDLIAGYLDDPRACMRKFLLNNPEFLQNALSSSEDRLRGRAQSLVENNFYNLEGE